MTKSYTTVRRFLFELAGMNMSLDRNYRDVINLSFVLPGLHLNIVETEKMLQHGIKNSRRGTSFQRKRLTTDD